MKRTSFAAGLTRPGPKVQCRTTDQAQPFNKTFPFFALPAEIRNSICDKVFNTSTSSNKPEVGSNTTLRLTYVPNGDAAVELLRRKPNRIYILRPDNFKNFALCSKRVYSEVLPVIARNTSLHLSGADIDYFQQNLPVSTFAGGLLEEVVKHTAHMAIETAVLSASLRFQNQLISGCRFSNLQRLTLHTAGPAEHNSGDVELAVSADDAESLLSTKKWPREILKNSFESVINESDSNFGNGPDGTRWPVILKEMQTKIKENKSTSTSSRQSGVKQIEVVWKLPLKNTIMNLQRKNSVILTGTEIVVDFDTFEIMDVSFHKMSTVQVQHREISTALAFSDKPNNGPLRAKRPSQAISFRPRN